MRLILFVALLIVGTFPLQAQTASQAQTGSYERGAVVFIQQDGRAMAPRVLAIAGDRVRVGSDGIFVNDVYVVAPHDLGSWPQSVVPKGHYFVFAESKSPDSTTRFWGLLPAERILGKAEL
jgi:type IV secretory pathway protease TraF